MTSIESKPDPRNPKSLGNDPSVDLENVNAAWHEQFERANKAEAEVERLWGQRAKVLGWCETSKTGLVSVDALRRAYEEERSSVPPSHTPSQTHACSEWCHCRNFPSEDA